CPSAWRSRAGLRAPPECLNRACKRKSIRPLIDRLKAFQGDFWPVSSRRPPRKAALEAHDVADDLGDRLIMLDRDLLVDIDGGVERARQRHVLHDRNIVLPGDF